MNLLALLVVVTFGVAFGSILGKLLWAVFVELLR